MSDSTHASVARILAIDLGEFTSVACDYRTADGSHTYTTVKTRPQVLHDLIVKRAPDRVVIEIGSPAGWVRDLCEALEVPLQIANPNHEAWRWKNVKRKTDRDDASSWPNSRRSDSSPPLRSPLPVCVSGGL